MTFSPEWQRHWSNTSEIDRIWSFQLAYMVQMRCGLDLTGQRILELGTGHGNNIDWLVKMGADYWGIEGSETAADVACMVHPLSAEQIAVGDFTQHIPFEGPFDIVIDRAALTHNNSEAIRRCIGMVWDILKPGGLFFASDWFSTAHSEAERGSPDGDATTRTGYTDGQFRGIGRVHFFGEVELARIFKRFDRIYLVERTERSPAPGAFMPWHTRPRWKSDYFDRTEYRSVVWDLVVRKPR